LKLYVKLTLGYFSFLGFFSLGLLLYLEHALPGWLRSAAPGLTSTQLTELTTLVFSRTGWLLATVFAVSTLFICWHGWKLTAPLRLLLQTLEKIAHGEPRWRLTLRTHDEIGDCSRVLTGLFDQVRSTVRDLSVGRDRINTILASMSDAVLALDREGRLLLLNRAAEELFHCTEPQVRGKYLVEVIRNYEAEKGVKQVLATGEPFTRELRLFPLRRQFFWLHGVPTTSKKGRTVGVVLVIRDITTLRQLEQVKTEFVANVSHELRTPLTSIKGFVETLLDGTLEDPALNRRFLTIINAESNRLQRLVDDLLTISRLENRRETAAPEQASLPDVTAKVITVLTPLAEDKEVALTANLPDKMPPLVISEDFLEQVLLNLIENAIKYTPAGGKVLVGARVENGRVRVEVADTGIGIPRESIPLLFARFFRVDQARSRELGGTGLGLAIVKHILEEYGGHITVASELGQGSVFAVTLRSWT
jgi:two-component system phosphate regulon sensor histidine kinase PhoR